MPLCDRLDWPVRVRARMAMGHAGLCAADFDLDSDVETELTSGAGSGMTRSSTMTSMSCWSDSCTACDGYIAHPSTDLDYCAMLAAGPAACYGAGVGVGSSPGARGRGNGDVAPEAGSEAGSSEPDSDTEVSEPDPELERELMNEPPEDEAMRDIWLSLDHLSLDLAADDVSLSEPDLDIGSAMPGEASDGATDERLWIVGGREEDASTAGALNYSCFRASNSHVAMGGM